MTAPSSDRAAIRQIIRGLSSAGWHRDYVYDGEERDPAVLTENATLETIMGVDEATLHVSRNGATGYVYFVMGNEPFEVAADWTLTLSDVIDPITDRWEDQ